MRYAPWTVGWHGEVVTQTPVGVSASACDPPAQEHYSGDVICATVAPRNAALIACALELLEYAEARLEAVRQDGPDDEYQLLSRLVRRAYGFPA